MISKDEIKTKSYELSVNTSDVQRDYVFGWLLAGIYHTNNTLRNQLILRGGNGCRKAYLEHARYSNDLDFSTQSEINPDQLKAEINRACGYAAELTGIKFALDENRIALKNSAREDNKVYEARIYFKGFYGEESYNIKVKLDLKEYDRIFLPLQRRNIIHSYSDASECKGEVVCYKLEELLASKLKALLQRQHSPDLYDFIYSVFFQDTINVNRLEVVKTFLKKTIYEPNPTVAKNLLLEIPFQVFNVFWHKYLVCPKKSLINFDDAKNKFKLAIPELFGLLKPSYAFAGGGYAGEYNLNYFSAKYRNVIMEAGRTRKILKMVYDGLERIIEPYSLAYKVRKDGVGREYLYAWDRKGGRSGVMSIKSYAHDKIQSLDTTDEIFEPRYTIELSRAGESSEQTYFSRPFSKTNRIRTRTQRAQRVRSFSGLSYAVECPVCNKRFRRSSYDTKLNKHKDSFGNQCYGSHGYMV